MNRLTIILFMLAACGGGSTNQIDANTKQDGGKHDAPIDVGNFDFGCGGTTACTLDKVCCTNPGPPIGFSCVAPASCPAEDKIACDGPDECGGGTPVCCGVDVPNGTGTYPNCNPASLGTSCTAAAACQTHLGQDCTETTKVRICHVKADCTEPANDQCCTFMSGGAELTFCIDSTTAALGGATCH